jgi:hypothetical protein
MNYSSTTGSSVHQTVSLLMSTKPLDVIVGQPTTKTMNRMTEQMAQMVAPVKTTAWGGLHGLLALVLDDTGYALITNNVIKTADALIKPVSVNPKINDKSSPYKILTLQDECKTLQKEFDLQEAITSIGVHRIIECVEEQYVEELNKATLPSTTTARSIFRIPQQPRSVYQRRLSSLGTYALGLNFGASPW